MNTITARPHVHIARIALALAMSAALFGCAAPHASTDPSLGEPIAVATAPIMMTDHSTAIDAGGVVQAQTTATIAARILATVREVRVAPGDRVRAGQTLIVLDGDDLAAAGRAARAAALAASHGAKAADAELLDAEAGLALARATHDRIANLQARRSATAQELDDATAALRRAEAHVAGASARVSQAAAAVESGRAGRDQAVAVAAYRMITAPFAGMITEKLVEPGNLASPGTPLLRLEDTNRFRLEVRVDESRAGQIRTGDAVPVFLGSGSAPVPGIVVEVSRAVDADARAFLVKIELSDVTAVRSGEFGKARFVGPLRRALTVPSAAIIRRGQLTSVFVVEDGVARMRLLNLSGSEVLAGLTESDVVILSPAAAITDGRRVSVGGRK